MGDDSVTIPLVQPPVAQRAEDVVLAAEARTAVKPDPEAAINRCVTESTAVDQEDPTSSSGTNDVSLLTPSERPVQLSERDELIDTFAQRMSDLCPGFVGA